MQSGTALDLVGECKGMGFDLFMFVLLLYTGLYIDGLYIFCI